MDNKIFNSFVKYSSVFVFAIGATVLLGYQFDITVLRSILPGFVAMNPLTAINFIFIALWMLVMNGSIKNTAITQKIFLIFISVFVLSIAVIRIVERKVKCIDINVNIFKQVAF